MIEFSRPFVPTASIEHVTEALKSFYQHGDGPFSKLVSSKISDLSGGGKVLLTPSCTAALEMASMLVGIEEGDEVIMPSYTFTSAATAVTKFGGVPVFVDISEETGCIDANLIEKAITNKTRAISWVNYGGNIPNIQEITRIANAFNLILIEDNAHGLGGQTHAGKLGSFGHFSTLSFHATKNLQCGEGGALVINDQKYLDRAEIIREKGTNRKAFLTGNVQKYQWVDKGGSYLLAEVLAAQLQGQLTNYQEIQRTRVRVWDYYFQELSQALKKECVDILMPNTDNVAHLFALIFKSETLKTELVRKMASLEIQVNSHYQPLHTSVAGRKLARAVGDFPVTNFFAQNLIRLPIWSMEEPEYSRVVVRTFLEVIT